MRQDSTSLLTLGGLGVLTIVVLFAASRLHSLGADVASLARRAIWKPTMQTITQEVTRSDGVTKVTVTTTRKDGESVADWIARHDEAVQALQGG